MKNKQFIVMVLILLALWLSDLFLTHKGLSQGQTEANIIMVWLFSKIGVDLVMILSSFIFVGFAAILINVVKEATTEKVVKLLYFAVYIMAISRAYIVGVWVGAIYE